MIMGQQDFEWAREALKQRRQELMAQSNLSAQSRDVVELDQTSVGRVSRMDAIQNQAMALATERNRELELVRIEAALKRLDDNDFGYCITCGEEIAEKRLRFDPALPTCIGCANAG